MEELERKTIGFEIKDLDEEEGTFSGYAATFSDKPDSYGDIIDPGAFKRTISKANMGNRIKVPNECYPLRWNSLQSISPDVL